VRHWRPQLADSLLSPFELVSKVLSLSVAGLILATQYPMLAEIRMRGFVGMLILLAASLAIGWLAGGAGSDNRKTMALTTALRNVGVGDRHRKFRRHRRGVRRLGLWDRGGVRLALAGAVVGPPGNDAKSRGPAARHVCELSVPRMNAHLPQAAKKRHRSHSRER
jgi:hypothetical protein